MSEQPVIWWVRRDFRLADNPALVAAVRSGAPVLPVFIFDEVVETHGAAPQWRLGEAVTALARALAAEGSTLTCRRGLALRVLRDLVAEVGASAVHWNRLYDPAARMRDETVKAGLKVDGVLAESHAGHLVHEPWEVQTGSGGYYKVYSPFWKAVRGREVGAPLPSPKLRAPAAWPQSDDPASWAMGAAMRRGADVLQAHVQVGERAARDRLGAFLENGIAAYKERRDLLAEDGTSGLSENLTYGEISARSCWHAGWQAMERGQAGAETFLKELIWRDFAYHLVFHTPYIVDQNWRRDWDAFPWNADGARPEVLAWKRGRTGMPIIDAAMREMYVTGRMHNRARMLVASYLTKHMMTHWKLGLDWFEDCLVDWDPASNAMGWQWAAGSGPDAAPYFRVFNPETQAEKFDAEGRYRRRWLAEIAPKPTDTALSYFAAIPKSWSMAPDDPYPLRPVVEAAEGRKRALAAYENRGF